MTIAVIGVGRVGAALARVAIAAGFEVNVASSGPAEDIELLAQVVIPGAHAMTTADAVRDAGIVIIAVPLHKHRNIDPTPLEGKIVVDAMNYWGPVDGIIDEFEASRLTSTEIVAEHFRGARVVRALNHIGYHEMEEGALPPGAPGRRALAVASDDEIAAREVMDFIERIGFDSLYSGALATARAFAQGTRIFAEPFTAGQLAHELEAAKVGTVSEPAR